MQRARRLLDGRLRVLSSSLGLLLALLPSSVAPAQELSASATLDEALNHIAYHELDERASAIAQIQTRDQAEQRRHEVRTKILAMIGGFPTERTPLNAKVVGSISGDGFRVEKIVY